MELGYRNNFQGLENENILMKRQIEELDQQIEKHEKFNDGLRVETHLNDELQNELESLRRNFNYEKAKQYYNKRKFMIYEEKSTFFQQTFNNLELFLKGSINDYVNQANGQQNRIDDLQSNGIDNKKSTCLEKVTSEFKKTEIFHSRESENNITDIFKKFSSSDINSEKFTELMILLFGFYNLVYSQLQNLKGKTSNNREEQTEKSKAEKLISSLTSKIFYKSYVKGLLSKENRVFELTLDFLLLIGKDAIVKNIEIFENSDIIRSLVANLKQSESSEKGLELQTKKFNLLGYIMEGSENCCKDLITIGGLQVIKIEIRKNFDPLFQNGEYFNKILNLIYHILKYELPTEDLNDRIFIEGIMSLLKECQNFDSTQYLFSIIYAISKYSSIRKMLCELGIFTQLIKLYDQSLLDDDKQMLFKMIKLFSRLVNENSFKIQLRSHTEITNNFNPFFEPFNIDTTAEPEEKLAAMKIIYNMILQGDPVGTRANLITSDYVKMLISNCLFKNDINSPIIGCAFDCLLAVTDCIKEQTLNIDEILIGVSKNFWSLKDEDKEKFILLLLWGIYYKTLNINVINPQVIFELLGHVQIWQEDQNENLFMRALVFICEMFIKPGWKEAIIANRFWENYITAKASNTTEVKKIWLNGLTHQATFDYFKTISSQNTQILKFLWNEINTQLSFNTLEATRQLSVSFDYKSMKRNILMDEFIEIFFDTVLQNFDKFVKFDDVVDLFSIITRLLNKGNVNSVLIKNKEMLEFINEATISDSGIAPAAMNILLKLYNNLTQKEIKQVFNENMCKYLKKVFNKIMAEPDIILEYFASEIYKGQSSKMLFADKQIEKYLMEQGKEEVFPEESWFEFPYDTTKSFIEDHILRSLAPYIRSRNNIQEFK